MEDADDVRKAIRAVKSSLLEALASGIEHGSVVVGHGHASRDQVKIPDNGVLNRLLARNSHIISLW